MIRNKYKERNNLHTNHTVDSNTLFAVVHPSLKVSGKCVFGNSLDDPLTARLEAVLGQWDNEMPASSNFTFLWRKKSAGAISGEPSGWRTVFMSLPPFEVLD